MGRVGFSSYVTERLTGFDGPPQPMGQTVERTMFPEFYTDVAAGPARGFGFPTCTGEITWRGPEFVQRDINEHYASDRDYVFAAARALNHEYRAIVDAGFVLQVDDPGLAMGWNRAEFADRSFADYRGVVAQHIEAINVALDRIPPERVRLHVCWGNGEWPHVRDVPLVEIIDVLYAAHVGAIYVEGANPRHGHEWRVFADHPLPEGMTLIAGVIDTVTNFVEHPDLVAERIERYASVVGPSRFMAATDCGFGTIARSQPRVHPTLAWAKLESLVEGARRAAT